MAEAIGALRAELSANAARFEADMKDARDAARKHGRGIQKQFKSMGKSIGGALASLTGLKGGLAGLAGAVTVGGFGVLTTRALQSADAIAKASDKIGLGVEALQELRYAAELSGVAQNTLDMAMQRFSRRVGEAAQGSGELQGTLEQYGIAVLDADGRQRALTDVLFDYAEAVKNAGSDQERLRMSFKAFDSEGAALVNLLRQGGASMAEMREEARRLGIVLDEDMVREAEKANDAFTRMRKILGANLDKAFISLAPAISGLGEAMAAMAPAFAAWVETMLPERFQSARALREEVLALEVQISSLREELARFEGDSTIPMAKGIARNLKRRIAAIDEEIARLEDLAAERENAARAAAPEITIGGGVVAPTRENTAQEVREMEALGDAIGGVSAAMAKVRGERRKAIIEGRRGLDQELRQQQLRLQYLGEESEEYRVQARLLEIRAQHGEQAARAMEADIRQLERLTEQTDAVVELKDEFISFGREATRAFADAATGTKSFGDALRQLASNALQRVAGKQVDNAIGSLFSAATSSFDFSSLFAGFMAEGGPVAPRQPYVVGEQGPEVFVPGMRGTVIPNHALAGAGGGGNVFNVDMRGASIEAVRRLEAFVLQINGSIEGRAVAANAEHARRTGGGR